MNRTPINGALLGNGAPTNRVNMVMGLIVSCVSSIVLAAMRAFSGVTSGIASSLLGLGATGPITGTTSASAVTSINLGALVVDTLPPLQTSAIAQSSIVLTRRGHIAATGLAQASSQMVLSARVGFAGSTGAQALSSMALVAFAADAPLERTTRMGPQNRETAVQ